MLGLGIALVVVGLIFVFFLSWFGLVISIVGLLILGAYLLGVGRRAAEPPSA